MASCYFTLYVSGYGTDEASDMSELGRGAEADGKCDRAVIGSQLMQVASPTAPVGIFPQTACPEGLPKPEDTLVTWNNLAFEWTISTITAPLAFPGA